MVLVGPMTCGVIAPCAYTDPGIRGKRAGKPDQNSGIGVNEGVPSDRSRLCLRCGGRVCTSMSGIPASRAGAALGQQGVPSRGPSTLVGVGAGSGGGEGGVSLSSGSPSNTSVKSRVRSSRSGSSAAGLTNTCPRSSGDFQRPSSARLSGAHSL